MPVRIRLASHPLARKKEPLYHIVVANSKTARQRKPLEVIGVYDPIPRYPTTPAGEILENKPKIKKISMNIDRVKYWLSVGAQPTDHCVRLFTKANLIPEKPSYKKSLERINIPPERVRESVKGWGRAEQGIQMTLSSRQQPPDSKPPVTHIGLVPQGDQVETGVRKVSQQLVQEVFQEVLPPHQRQKLNKVESMPVEPVIKATSEGDTASYKRLLLDKEYTITGRPNFDESYAAMSYDRLQHEFLEWYLKFQSVRRRTDESWHRIEYLKTADPACLRFFMAYVKPKITNSRSYNLPRIEFLNMWLMRRETKPTKWENETLLGTLRGLFEHWDFVSEQLERKSGNSLNSKGKTVWGFWGPEERKMGRDIKNRRIVLEVAGEFPRLRDGELDHWNSMWALTLAERAPKEQGTEAKEEEPATSEGKEVQKEGELEKGS